MTEITNIDAIIELIMREARARKGDDLIHKTYTVQVLIDERLTEIRQNLREERRIEERKKKEAEWAKGI